VLLWEFELQLRLLQQKRPCKSSNTQTILAMKNLQPLAPTFDVKSWHLTLWKTQVLHNQIFLLIFGSCKFVTRRVAKLELGYARMCGRAQIQLFIFIFYFFSNFFFCKCYHGNLSYMSNFCNKKKPSPCLILLIMKNMGSPWTWAPTFDTESWSQWPWRTHVFFKIKIKIFSCLFFFFVFLGPL